MKKKKSIFPLNFFKSLCKLQMQIRKKRWISLKTFLSYFCEQNLHSFDSVGKSNILYFQSTLMFGLWYLKEAYSVNRNSAPKLLMIRVMVTEQFMKMFHNCAILQNGAILEHFYELLRNRNSDRYNFWCVVSVSQIRLF